ncbi:hypothetical protein ID866_3562 [Astraeus odoratus]|nr:hypothetical protein ID866_3562 [Astraeus odoratus]
MDDSERDGDIFAISASDRSTNKDTLFSSLGSPDFLPSLQTSLRVGQMSLTGVVFSLDSRFPTSSPLVLVEQLENAYLAGFVLLQVFVMTISITADENSAVQFLPLMITSVYCAMGLVWAFIRLSVLYLSRSASTAES